MDSTLLIKSTSGRSLDHFVGSLSKGLWLLRWEERQSSNYLEERYFRSRAFGLKITLALADDPEFQDFEVWLNFEVESGCRGDKFFLDGLVDCAARSLALYGCEVMRPFNLGRSGSGGVIYRPNQFETSQKHILVEEFKN